MVQDDYGSHDVAFGNIESDGYCLLRKAQLCSGPALGAREISIDRMRISIILFLFVTGGYLLIVALFAYSPWDNDGARFSARLIFIPARLCRGSFLPRLVRFHAQKLLFARV